MQTIHPNTSTHTNQDPLRYAVAASRSSSTHSAAPAIDLCRPAMASSSSSYTLSHPLQLPRYASSSARLGQAAGAPYSRPLLTSAGCLQTTNSARGGLRSVAATSYQREAQGHGDNGMAAASALRHPVVADDAALVAELRAARVRGAPRSPKGRPGEPREGSGGKVHAAAPTTLLRQPKEGSGGQGGSIH